MSIAVKQTKKRITNSVWLTSKASIRRIIEIPSFRAKFLSPKYRGRLVKYILCLFAIVRMSHLHTSGTSGAPCTLTNVPSFTTFHDQVHMLLFLSHAVTWWHWQGPPHLVGNKQFTPWKHGISRDKIVFQASKHQFLMSYASSLRVILHMNLETFHTSPFDARKTSNVFRVSLKTIHSQSSTWPLRCQRLAWKTPKSCAIFSCWHARIITTWRLG